MYFTHFFVAINLKGEYISVAQELIPALNADMIHLAHLALLVSKEGNVGKELRADV